MKEPLLQRDLENDGPLWLWLGAATRGLSDDSRHRVEQEISEHFRDAVEERKAAGLSESDARAEALRDLGSHEAARRAFRRAYLTSRQDKLTRDYLRSPTLWRSIPWGVLFIVGTVAVLMMPESRTRWLLAVGIIGGMAVSLATLCVATRWLRERGRLRTSVAVGVLADWCFYFLLLVGTNYLAGESRSVSINSVLLAATFLVLLVLYLPVLRKLGNLPTRPA